MAVDILYSGLDLFTTIQPNKNVSITYNKTRNETVVTAIDSAQGKHASPGFRIDGVQISQNRVYRVTVVGRTINAVRPYLWVAKNTGSPNLVPDHIVLGETSSAIYADFAFTDTVSVPAGISSVFMGILMNRPAIGESFAVSSIIMKTMPVDYITPYQRIEVDPVFENLIISSDVNIGGFNGLVSDLITVGDIIQSDAALISYVSAIIATDSSMTSDVAFIFSLITDIQNDITALITTDHSISSDLVAFSTTDTYLATLQQTLQNVVGSHVPTSDFAVEYMSTTVSDMKTNISGLLTTDQHYLDYIRSLEATDTARQSDITALQTTDISFLSFLGRLTTTDSFLSSEIAELFTGVNDVTNDIVGLNSDTGALAATDASIVATLNTIAISFALSDVDLNDQIEVLLETDASFASDIASLIVSDAAHMSDIAGILATDMHILSLLSNGSDIVALKTTDTFLISQIGNLITSDVALSVLVNSVVNTDTYLTGLFSTLTSQMNSVTTTDTYRLLEIGSLNSDISAIWVSDLAFSSTLTLQSSQITAIQNSDAARSLSLTTMINQINAILTTDISVSSDIAAIAATDTSINALVSAIWATDLLFFSDLAAIWTTDSYFLSQITGTGVTSDKAALIATDTSLVAQITGISNSETAIYGDIVAIWTTEASFGNLTTLTSEFNWMSGQISVPVYDDASRYVTGNMVWYNGHIFSATSQTTAISPRDYLFYDDFSAFCNSVPLTGGMYGYETSNNFTSTFTAQTLIVSTSGSSAVVTTSSAKSFTIDPGTTTMYVDLIFSTMPVYTSDQPWFAMSTAGAGVLTFQSGNSLSSEGSTNIFTIGSKGGSLPVGVTATSAISGVYTPPVSGNLLRIGRLDGHTVTLQVSSSDTFGGLATVTLSSDVLTTTSISIGFGFSGTYTLSSISSYINATSETAKPWSLMTQTPSRQHVTSNALTLNARFGRFFWAPGVLGANRASALMTWTNSELNPQSHLFIDVVQWGTSSSIDTASVTVDVIAIGQGSASLQLLNGADAFFSPLVTVVFSIYDPISFT